MTDRPPLNESEVEARRSLVSVARSMLSGQVSFFEGTMLVRNLREMVGGLADHDEDFTAFDAIVSETDHLPLAAQRHFWSPDTLACLESEFQKKETWASSFAHESCKKLIARFDHV